MAPYDGAAAALRERVGRRAVPRERATPGLADDVAAGLLTPPLELPPKHFYDERGSRLFDRICETPEYYPTRAEDALLAQAPAAIVDVAAPDDILEFGSGMARKTRRLLDACASGGRHPTYSAFDISEEALDEAARSLVAELRLAAREPARRRLRRRARTPAARRRAAALLLSRQHHRQFLPRGGGALPRRGPAADGAWGLLLLGADRVKAEAVLNAAYNDSGGLTEAFNLNLLQVLNDGVGADFKLANFAHEAAFNPPESQVEMRLVSRTDQVVRLEALDAELTVRHGDSILTEISRKFTEASLASLLADAGFRIAAHYTPDNEWFSLVLAKPLGGGSHHA